MRFLSVSIFLFLAACTAQPPSAPSPEAAPAPPATKLMQIGAIEPVPDDPDDPAVWLHPRDPSLNLIIGTNKVEKPNVALLVFDMKGKILQKITGWADPTMSTSSKL